MESISCNQLQIWFQVGMLRDTPLVQFAKTGLRMPSEVSSTYFALPIEGRIPEPLDLCTGKRRVVASPRAGHVLTGDGPWRWQSAQGGKQLALA